jgi:type VI protein secretion system component Hcp
MPAYVEIPGIQGSAEDANHKNWIQVDRVTWSASRNVNTAAGSSVNREGSSISFSEVDIWKKIDEGSIRIATRFWNMNSAATCKIDICRQGAGSGDESLMLFELEEAIISMHEIRSDGAVPMEHFTISYTKFKETGKTAPSSNKLGKTAITGYDLKNNESV